MRFSLVVALSLLLASCSKDDASLAAKSHRVFGTVPVVKDADRPELVALGAALYTSTELSVNGKQSCASCHPVAGGRPGTDLLVTSPGALGKSGTRNSPTVLNAAHHFVQFWDGRAKTLEEQAKGPMLNPIEMGMPDEHAVNGRLRAMQSVPPAMFRAAFPGEADPFTIEHAARAIAAFERTLRTSDRFDDFQKGDLAALSGEEKRGLRLFMASGCTSCHGGPLLGGNQFQKLGIVNPYPTKDEGRFAVTSSSADKFVFKVPSLRNVALTPPYFHDGSVPKLEDAVDRMAWHQLGTKLAPADRDAIVAFLRTLSDKSRAKTDVATATAGR